MPRPRPDSPWPARRATYSRWVSGRSSWRPVVSSSSPPDSHGVGSTISEMCTQRTALSTPASPATSRTSRSRRRSRSASIPGCYRSSRFIRRFVQATVRAMPLAHDRIRFRSAADPRARARDEQGGVAPGRAAARARARGRGDRPARLRRLAAGPADGRGPRATRWRRSRTSSGSSARTWRATRSAAGSRSRSGRRAACGRRARCRRSASPPGARCRTRARRAGDHARGRARRWRRSRPRSRAAASPARALSAHAAARPWRIPPDDAAQWMRAVADAPAFWDRAAGVGGWRAAAAGLPGDGRLGRARPAADLLPPGAAGAAAAAGRPPRGPARLRARADVGRPGAGRPGAAGGFSS